MGGTRSCTRSWGAPVLTERATGGWHPFSAERATGGWHPFSDDQADAYLGSSVSEAGDVDGDGYADVIVGAENYDAGKTDEGAAFVFLGNASGIAGCTGSSPPRCGPTAAAAQLESDQEYALLGSSVSGAGDVDGDGYADVIVGAKDFDAGQNDEGAAFVFLGSASGIADGNPTTAAAQLESDQADALLGSSVSGAGDVDGDGYADVIVGTPFYDAGDNDEGAAFVYLGGSPGIVDGDRTTAAAQLEPDQTGAGLGRSVSGAGDVNGDGYADVIVGATGYDAGETDEGAAFVYHGSASGIEDADPFDFLIPTPATQLESNQAGANLGNSVSGAGDVNGDGYADVVVGASQYAAGETDEGAAFVFLGSASGIADGNPATAAAQLESDQAHALLALGYHGPGVSGAGDVNGDGYADIIVGAVNYDAGEANEGAAFVFLGGASGIADCTGASPPRCNPTTAAAQLESNQAGASLGWSVSGAGDVNGDGYADVIVGARQYEAGETWEGAAFVFLGSASGVADGNPSTAAARIEGDEPGALLGDSVSGAGDVNGDGYADVIVSAVHDDGMGGLDPKVYVFHGGASGIQDVNPTTAATELSLVGLLVSDAGDVNGDVYTDVMVGLSQHVFVFLGSASGIADGDDSTAAAHLETDEPAEGFDSFSGAGDVNGDGYADVILGAGYYGAADSGAAWVFLGNDDGDGRPVVAQQRRDDGSGTSVEPWGSSESPDTFQVRMTATHPEGRGRVKLEVESCAPGMAFGDTSCAGQVSGSWTDVGASSSGVTLTETVPIPFGETLRRWRARVLYAPYSVTQSGITPPANPAHGPWRRVSAQSVEADVRRQMQEEVTVPSGTSVSESLLGGPPSWGGVDVTFDDTSGGDLTAQFTPVPVGPSLQDLLADPGSLNFSVGGDPAQLWEIQLNSSFSGTVTLTFQYDDQNLLVPEANLEVAHYEGGSWVPLTKVAQDLVDNTITVTTTSLSPFLLTGPESSSIGWTFSGTAAGGSVSFTVGAVFLEVETSSGQTAAEVATAVAAAIDGDAILTAAGITATADGNAVTTDGAVTSTAIDDSGLDYTPVLLPAQLPSLSGSGAALLAGLIVTAVSYAWRQRRTEGT